MRGLAHRTTTQGNRMSLGEAAVGLLVAIIAATACRAGELTVSVIDPSGHGVTDVVVVVAPAEAAAPHATPTSPVAIMDQRDRAFSPRVLVVRVGTSVEFPNNDTVSHQVYSFSQAKKFQLPLYKGKSHPPVTFDRAGLVVLGCNIHDQMVGYIYVTDAPFFGKTDPAGTLRVPGLSAGEYRISVWSPFIADRASALTRTVRVDAQAAAASRVQLVDALRARPEPRPQPADWEY
jgi:plastocyanin